MESKFVGVVIALMCLQPCARAKEKLVCEVLPAGRRPYGDSMYISNRLGLRDKAKQVSDDLTTCTDDERRVSELMD